MQQWPHKVRLAAAVVVFGGASAMAAEPAASAALVSCSCEMAVDVWYGLEEVCGGASSYHCPQVTAMQCGWEWNGQQWVEYLDYADYYCYDSWPTPCGNYFIEECG